MTDDELTIETLRFRAPVVIALSGGQQFCVLTPGWEPETRICTSFDLWSIVRAYTEWNALPEAIEVKRRDPQVVSRLSALGLDDTEIDEALNAVLGRLR